MAGGGHDLVVGAEPSLCLADVEKLLRDHDDEKIVKAIGHVYGVVVSLAPIGMSSAGFALWPLLDVKNELADAITHLLPFLTKKREESYTTRLKRLKTAATTLIYVAYLEEARSAVRKWCTTTEDLDSSSPYGASGSSQYSVPDLVLKKPPTIGPLLSFDEYRQFAGAIYSDMTRQLFDQLEARRGSTLHADSDLSHSRLVGRALFRLEAAFVELCANHDELLVWAQCDVILRGHDRLGERLHNILDRQSEIDLGLAHLQELTTQVVSAVDTHVPRVIEAIHLAYADDLTSPISVADEMPASQGFAFPTKGSAFIPQRFACVQQNGGLPIHDETFWAQEHVRNDVGLFLLRSFLAADAVHRPVLILGHPGSGKSLLSEILAARLTPPWFTTIRVSLRETDATREIEDQIQDAIRQATGLRINWIELSEIAEAPPIVVFDGLDELLLATGNSHVNFLERLARFQHREFVQGRPVRVVVTSRLTLIHRMRVADGTYVVRLLDFSSDQQQTWVDLWNGENTAYFTANELAPFAIPDNDFVQALAAQPLLLLMLAIYDAYENSLAEAAASSRAELYESIVQKFVERERGKGTETGGAFRALDTAERARVLAQDMDRLSIVALAMHKRARLFVTKDELDADLVAYGKGGRSDLGDVLALSTAETLLGQFFFIHRSETATDEPRSERTYAFEFLHNTFGEFLLASLIAKRLGERCRALLAAGNWPEVNEVARMEAAAAALPQDLHDALQWHLLCMRPVVLEMLEDLLARPQVGPVLANANDLFARELLTCTSLVDPQATLQSRTVECANILSIASVLPDRPCLIACRAGRWQQIVGLLRGSLSFEEMTQLVSGLQTTVREGIVEIDQSSLALTRSDEAGAARQAAVALSDRSLLATTQLATIDSLVSLSDRIPGRLADEELLLASRVLRPAIWRRLNEGDRQRLLAQLMRSARIGMLNYPNASITALTTAVSFRDASSFAHLLPAFLARSLGSGVEPEPVADLVFTMMSPSRLIQNPALDLTVPDVTASDVDERTRDHLIALLDGVVDAAISTGPVVGSRAKTAEHTDRRLIALCWLVWCEPLLSEDQSQVVRDRVLTDDLFMRIEEQAPSFIWLPAAVWLTFNPSIPNEAWLERWLVDERARAPNETRSVDTAMAVLRALWSIVPDPGEIRNLIRQFASFGGRATLVAMWTADAPTGLREGWQYLERKLADVTSDRGWPPLRFNELLREELSRVRTGS